MLTILTATYNRGNLLRRVYESLLLQSENQFIWVIMDDGSIDDTKGIVSEIQKEAPFRIEYYYHENTGKQKAINYVIQHISTKYCMFLDSDDQLLPNVMSEMIEWIKSVEEDDEFAGVAGLCCTLNGDVLCEEAEKKNQYVNCTNLERGKYGLSRDCAEIYKTELLKKYPFPEFENEKFISECVVWDKIAYDGYKLRWYYKPIKKVEYLDDGLSTNVEKLLLNNIQGFAYVTKQSMSIYSFRRKLAALGLYGCICKKKFSTRESARLIECNIFMYVVCRIFYSIKHGGTSRE